jgi:hypothetical protein
MAKNKKEIPLVFVLLASLAILFLLQNGSDFMGAFVTTTENVEPLTIEDWETMASESNDSLVMIDPVEFAYLDETYSLATYSLDNTSDFGMFTITDTYSAGFSCSDILALIDASEVSTSYSVIEARQVLIVPGGFRWCNFNDQLMISGADISQISDYYGDFEVDTTVEITLSENSCEDVDGVWSGLVCTCWDDSTIVELNETCPEDTTVVDDRQDTLASESVATPTVTPDVVEPTLKDKLLENKTVLLIAGIVIISLLLYYFGFEMGPNKGFIKKKRKSRSRRGR